MFYTQGEHNLNAGIIVMLWIADFPSCIKDFRNHQPFTDAWAASKIWVQSAHQSNYRMLVDGVVRTAW